MMPALPAAIRRDLVRDAPSTATTRARGARPAPAAAGSVAAAGCSLLELLVATACTTLVAGAVFSLLVGSAASSRRAWNALAARRAVGAAVAAVAGDLADAGTGLESAGAVQVGGERVPVAASTAERKLKTVRARGTAIEIREAGPGSRFVVDSAAVAAGDLIVAVGFAARPPAAPLPLGVVTVVAPRGGRVELWVAWRAAEAAKLAAWGPPRALLPVELREYDVRASGESGALQLGRRTNGGIRQPVVDGLDALRVIWIVDSDGDGRADTRREVFSGSGVQRACAVRVEARATPVRARLSTSPAAAGAAAEIATRWVTLGGC